MHTRSSCTVHAIYTNMNRSQAYDGLACLLGFESSTPGSQLCAVSLATGNTLDCADRRSYEASSCSLSRHTGDFDNYLPCSNLNFGVMFFNWTTSIVAEARGYCVCLLCDSFRRRPFEGGIICN